MKKAKAEGESAKVSVRNVRRAYNDKAKNLEEKGVSEDEVKNLVNEIQKLTDKFIEEVDNIVNQKEKDIMTV